MSNDRIVKAALKLAHAGTLSLPALDASLARFRIPDWEVHACLLKTLPTHAVALPFYLPVLNALHYRIHTVTL